ncbi:protein of unknown function [Shewanella benthica]|uniref:Uncharacterized protein n=1 Tax=Shewanella benthica TaxID=43661 RepID=A0A330LZK5_9GAMM|nr:protein of unknown function [Shewanella benthica]
MRSVELIMASFGPMPVEKNLLAQQGLACSELGGFVDVSADASWCLPRGAP